MLRSFSLFFIDSNVFLLVVILTPRINLPMGHFPQIITLSCEFHNPLKTPTLLTRGRGRDTIVSCLTTEVIMCTFYSSGPTKMRCFCAIRLSI